MKNRDRIKILIIAICSLLIGGGILFGISSMLSSSLALDEGIDNISVYVDENNNPSTALIVLENINYLSKNNVSGNTYSITTESDITLSFTDSVTNEVITPTNNKITIGENGLSINVGNLSKGNVYYINLTADTHKRGYKAGFKKAVLKLDYTGILTASLDKLYDEDNNEISLDDNDKLVLVYSTEDEKVRLRANSDVTIMYYFSTTDKTNEELNNVNWQEYNKETYLYIESNGYLFAKAKYKNDSYSNISRLRINNIDKLNPILTVNSITLTNNNTRAAVNYTVDDADATDESGKSGVKAYYFSSSRDNDESRYIEVDGPTTTTTTVDENGDYFVHIKDNAGNIAVQKVEVGNIPEPVADPVLLVLNSPNKSLIGKVYTSFTAMKNDFTNNNITSDDEVIVQVIGNITKQKYVAENVNLILDLNGYEVSNNTEDPTITITNTATVRLLDKKYNISDYFDYEHSENNPEGVVLSNVDYASITHGSGVGSIKNNYTAININQGGKFTLGEETSPDPAHIEYPDHEKPYIYGANIAIISNGEFNYYDGIVKGEVALDGDVNDTPRLYGPNVVVEEGTENTIMTLEIVTDIEARIGKTRYTLLESAIAAANNLVGTTDDQIKIVIMKNIVKTETIEIPSNKNIIIDLNGFSFNSSSGSYVLNNEGRTVLMDSAGFGEMHCSTQGFINNVSGATLTVESGTYSCSSNSVRFPVIRNNPNSTLTMNGGTLSSTTLGTVVNNNGGTLTINNGTFIGNNSTNNYYIYDEVGSVVVNTDVAGKDFVDFTRNITLDNIISEQQYGFVKDGFVLKSNNQNVHSSTAYGYFEIDLSSYVSDDIFDINVDYTIGSENRYDYGYFKVTETTEKVDYDSNNPTNVSGSETNGTKSVELTGGKKYYLHFGYRKDGSSNGYEDTYTINNIELVKYAKKIGNTTINGGDFSGGLNCYYNKSNEYNNEIKGGTFGCTNSVYNILGKTKVSNGTFSGNVVNDAYDMIISNGAFKKVINGNNMTISGGTFEDVNNTLVTNSIYSSNRPNLNITGGSFDRIKNYYYMNISNATINDNITYSSVDLPLEDNNMIIDNVTFNYTNNNFSAGHNSIDISRKGLTLTIDQSTINVNVKPTSRGNIANGIAINNDNNSITINDSNINMNSVNLYENAGSQPYTIFRGINNSAISNVTLSSSNITLTSDNSSVKTDAIYNTNKGNIAIGTKEGTYNHDENVITSATNGIINYQGNIKLYDGYIKAKTLTTDSYINDTENNYYINMYDQDGYHILDLTSNGPGNILNTRTNQSYSGLANALSAAQTGDTLKYTGDVNYETKGTGYIIPDDKDVSIDLNGKIVYFGGGLLNNGKVRITNSSQQNATVYSHSIINNNDMTISAGIWHFEVDNNEAVLNNGRVIIENSIYYTKSTNNSYYFTNNNDLTLGNDTIVYTYNSSSFADNRINILLTNNTGTSVINGGTYNYDQDTEYLETNNGKIETRGGTLTINGGTYNRIKLDTYGQLPDYSVIGISEGQIEYTNVYGNYKLIKQSGHDGSSYRYRIPVDLSEYTGDVTIDVEYTATNDYSSNFFTITDQNGYNGAGPSRPSGADYYSRTSEIYSRTVQGGQIYYVTTTDDALSIYDISIKQNNNTVSLFKPCTININGGTFNNLWRNNVYIANINIINTNNPTFVNKGINIYNSTVNANGGTFNNCLTGVIVSDSTTGTLKNLTIDYNSGDNYVNSYYTQGIKIDGTFNNITIDNADIDIDIKTAGSSQIETDYYGGGKYAFGIADTGYSNNITLKNSNFLIKNNRNAYGVYTNDNMDIGSSVIKALSSDAHGYGVVPVNSSATVNISDGIEDVSTTLPDITGSTNAVYRMMGTLNFYDGILRGLPPINGGITDKPDGYELLEGNDGTYDTVTLYSSPVIVNNDTGTQYATIQRGFNSCTDNITCNLELLVNSSLTKPVTLANNKIVNFNLGGFTITAGTDSNLINNGNLTITNGTIQVGSIDDDTSSAVVNNGIFTISTGAIVDSAKNVHSRLITNNSTGYLYLSGGTINQTYDTPGYTAVTGSAIYNIGGTVELNSGTLNIQSSFSNYKAGIPIYNGASLPEYTNYNSYSYSNTQNIPTTVIPVSSYVPIDLTGYSGNVDVKVSTSYYHTTDGSLGNKVYFKENTNSTPTYSQTEDTNVLKDQPGTATVQGGKIYYMYVLGSGYIDGIDIIQGSNVKHLVKKGRITVNMTINELGTDKDAKTLASSNGDIIFNNSTITGSPIMFLLENSTLNATGLTADNLYMLRISNSKANITNRSFNVSSYKRVYIDDSDVVFDNI